jgi:hypothetical protein
MKYVIGFTGTRNGMTQAQRNKISELIKAVRVLATNPVVGLHGDCIGADENFDDICRDQGLQTWCRPCTFESMRARTPAKEIAEPKTPMARNRDIIAQSTVLLACPPNYEEIKKGSGTWATIRYGRQRRKCQEDLNVYVVFPDGSISAEIVVEE